MFKTDLQIAQECNMEHILKVAEKAGIPEEYVDCYGKYKGKISSKYYDKIKADSGNSGEPYPRRRRQNNRYHRPDRGIAADGQECDYLPA